MVFPAFGLVLGTSLRRRGRDGIWERRPEPPWSGRGNPHPLSLAGARGGEFLPGGGQKADGGGALEGKRLRSAPIRSEAPAGLGRWARVPPSLPEPRDAGPTGRLVPGAPPPREEDRAAPPRLPGPSGRLTHGAGLPPCWATSSDASKKSSSVSESDAIAAPSGKRQWRSGLGRAEVSREPARRRSRNQLGETEARERKRPPTHFRQARPGTPGPWLPLLPSRELGRGQI